MFISKSKYDEVVESNAELNEQLITANQERDAAISERDALQKRIDTREGNETATLATLNEVVSSLDTLDESVQTAPTPAEKAAATTALVSALRQSPGATTATITSKKEVTATDPDQNVVKDNKSFMENMQAVKDEFLPSQN